LDVPFRELLEHACTDADVTLQLYQRLKKELENRNLFKQFADETMVLLRALTDRECNGVRVEVKAMQRTRKAVAKQADALKRAVIAEVGREFDLDSSTDTASVLRAISPFGELAGSRISTAQLEQLGGTHYVPRLIVKYRRAQKLARELTTLSASIKDKKVWPIFSQVRWAHGCLSSSDPRICGPDGPLPATAILDRTISQRMNNANRSLTILERASADETLKRDINRGFGGLTIAKYNILRDLDQKDVLLAVAIGLSDAALSRRFLIDRVMAACIRQAAKRRYVKLFEWLDSYCRVAMSQGFACHDGRLKYLEGLKSSNVDKRQNALVSALRWTIGY
jgi:DNA polymerase-1